MYLSGLEGSICINKRINIYGMKYLLGVMVNQHIVKFDIQYIIKYISGLKGSILIGFILVHQSLKDEHILTWVNQYIVYVLLYSLKLLSVNYRVKGICIDCNYLCPSEFKE